MLASLGLKEMQRNRSSTQESTQVSTNTNNSSQQVQHIYTLENLVKTLEEVATHLAAN
ncbi:serine dehydratase [Trichormus sp. NMC-1]|uniref:serine dehydratase n=1 Tax=Trichormus sp. NMC-1 TaxID=1853259 RepID=UPI000B242B83|nr:serine dehydratase [Trichormus sp. NMC-1]